LHIDIQVADKDSSCILNSKML